VSIRVLIADDQPLIRSGFRLVIEGRPDLDLVGEAEDGAQAVELASSLDPDVVLMDVRMPVLDGIEATRRIVARGSEARIVIITTFDLDEYVYESIRAGASAFLLKDIRPEELADAIRVVAAGNSLLGPSATRRLVEEFARDTPAGKPVSLSDLTAREVEILELVAYGLSNAEIAARLYLGETTVKTHVSAVLRKLGVRDRVQAVIAAYDARLVAPQRPRGPA
jgi:DNA-binding NarL/FixJ family response regulator